MHDLKRKFQYKSATINLQTLNSNEAFQSTIQYVRFSAQRISETLSKPQRRYFSRQGLSRVVKLKISPLLTMKVLFLSEWIKL